MHFFPAILLHLVLLMRKWSPLIITHINVSTLTGSDYTQIWLHGDRSSGCLSIVTNRFSYTIIINILVFNPPNAKS